MCGNLSVGSATKVDTDGPVSDMLIRNSRAAVLTNESLYYIIQDISAGASSYTQSKLSQNRVVMVANGVIAYSGTPIEQFVQPDLYITDGIVAGLTIIAIVMGSGLVMVFCMMRESR